MPSILLLLLVDLGVINITALHMQMKSPGALYINKYLYTQFSIQLRGMASNTFYLSQMQ